MVAKIVIYGLAGMIVLSLLGLLFRWLYIKAGGPELTTKN